MASRPFGVSGVMTMKMMISTSNTSIMGVMLMSALGPPEPPTAIPIVNSLFFNSISLLLGRRGGFGALLLHLLGEQAQVVHTAGAHVVHNFHYLLVAGALVGLQIAS